MYEMKAANWTSPVGMSSDPVKSDGFPGLGSFTLAFIVGLNVVQGVLAEQGALASTLSAEPKSNIAAIAAATATPDRSGLSRTFIVSFRTLILIDVFRGVSTDACLLDEVHKSGLRRRSISLPY
jgi:hypothetical protein